MPVIFFCVGKWRPALFAYLTSTPRVLGYVLDYVLGYALDYAPAAPIFAACKVSLTCAPSAAIRARHRPHAAAPPYSGSHDVLAGRCCDNSSGKARRDTGHGFRPATASAADWCAQTDPKSACRPRRPSARGRYCLTVTHWPARSPPPVGPDRVRRPASRYVRQEPARLCVVGFFCFVCFF